MRLNLSPRDSSFYELFAASAEHLVTGAGLLQKLLVVPFAGRAEVGDAMQKAEHDCDDATHAILKAVDSTFVTPFDREDIYKLASQLDDVMDFMEAAVDLVVLYQIADLPPELHDQVDVLSEAARLTADAMPKLRTMKDLRDYWIEVNRLENTADHIYRRFLARLFGGEFDALTVLKLKDVCEQLEAAADAFEHVANTVETIAVKES